MHLDFVVEGEDINDAVQRAVAAGATLEKAREHQQLGQARADGRSIRTRLLFRTVSRTRLRRDLRLLKASGAFRNKLTAWRFPAHKNQHVKLRRWPSRNPTRSDFNDPNKLGEGKNMVEKLSNLVARTRLFAEPRLA